MKKVIIKIGCTALALVAAAALWHIRADREYIHLPPVEGAAVGTTLASTSQYELTFIAQRATVSRLGLFMRPLNRSLPAEAIRISLTRDGQALATHVVPSTLLDSIGATQIRFNPPIETAIGEHLTAIIEVPAALDGHVRLLQRTPDETFDSSNVVFTIDGVDQTVPAAYQVYYRYTSPVVRALAVLLGIAVVQLWVPGLFTTWSGVLLYSFLVSSVVYLPLWRAGERPFGLTVTLVAALAGMWKLGAHYQLSPWARLGAAHAFAFTSWFTLHGLAGREVLGLIGALLPLATLLVVRIPRYRLLVAAGIVVLGLAAVALASPSVAIEPGVTAGILDIFLDPYQVPSSQKTSDPNASWDHFGSYLGVIPACFALLGAAVSVRRHPWFIALFLLGLVGATMPLLSELSAYSFFAPLSYFIILATFTAAIWVGFGIDTLWSFIGRNHWLGSLIIATLLILAWLDGLQVLATTLEFGRL